MLLPGSQLFWVWRYWPTRYPFRKSSLARRRLSRVTGDGAGAGAASVGAISMANRRQAR